MHEHSHGDARVHGKEFVEYGPEHLLAQAGPRSSPFLPAKTARPDHVRLLEIDENHPAAS